MSAHGTEIEWTHVPGFRGETWNPVSGCEVVSPGCTHCYAQTLCGGRLAKLPLYAGTTSPSNAGPVFNGTLRAAPDLAPVWSAPLRWRAPRCIFVCSLSDLFHEHRPQAHIDRVLAIAAAAPRHRFLILTKRGEVMRVHMSGRDLTSHILPKVAVTDRRGQVVEVWGGCAPGLGAVEDLHAPSHARCLDADGRLTAFEPWPLANVWMGVSVEDQDRTARLHDLARTPAARRFASVEPLLGAVDLERIAVAGGIFNALSGAFLKDAGGIEYLPALDWVIVGGESGARARPMHPDWVRALRDACARYGVPFFFKQWGAWCPRETVEDTRRDDPRKLTYFGDLRLTFLRAGKAQAGAVLDGRRHAAFPAAGAAP